MKYFYLTVLFLTMITTSAVAKSPVLAAKSISNLPDIRHDGSAYQKVVGKSANGFYSAMEKQNKPSKVKIEVLAAKAEFEDIDDVIANIENDKLPAPKRKKSVSVIKPSRDVDDILSFLDEKNDFKVIKAQDKDSTVAENAFPKPMLNPRYKTAKAAAEKNIVEALVAEKTVETKIFERKVEKEPSQKQAQKTNIQTYVAPSVSDAEKKEIAEIIAEDAAWEADWKKISAVNTKRDDKAFDKLLDESFSFLPGQIPVEETIGGSKAAKMITADDIEKLFGLEDKKSSKLPDFKVGNFEDNGRWLWPVDQSAYQRISSKFGYRTHPVTGRRSFHKGVDIAAKRGTKVLASRSGKVELVTYQRYLGKYVKIRHKDGSYALYGHLSKRLAKQGQYVKAGQVIGKVGSTGRSTGPHLDFSIRVKEKAVDPLKRLSVPRKLARR